MCVYGSVFDAPGIPGAAASCGAILLPRRRAEGSRGSSQLNAGSCVLGAREGHACVRFFILPIVGHAR